MEPRTLILAVHAAAAVVALVAGLSALHTGRGLRVHQAAMITMAACLGGSLPLGWAGFGTTERVMFSGLAGLSVFMVVQAFRSVGVRRDSAAAGVVLRSGTAPVSPRFVDVLGFNVIALSVAGTVVPVLRVGGGAIGVVISVAVAVAIGHVLLERRKTAVVRLRDRSTSAIGRPVTV